MSAEGPASVPRLASQISCARRLRQASVVTVSSCGSPAASAILRETRRGPPMSRDLASGGSTVQSSIELRPAVLRFPQAIHMQQGRGQHSPPVRCAERGKATSSPPSRRPVRVFSSAVPPGRWIPIPPHRQTGGGENGPARPQGLWWSTRVPVMTECPCGAGFLPPGRCCREGR